MKGNLIQGGHFFWQGLRLIFTAGLRRYMIGPLIVNIFLFVLVFAGLAWYLFHHLSQWVSDYPKWVIILIGWLFWLLYASLSLVISAFTFTIATNIIASPFYGLLAEAVERHYQPMLVSPPFTLSTVFRILAREGIKLLYFLPGLLVCGLLFLFPPIWPLMPFVVFFLFAWFAAIQYIDYCPDNQGLSFKVMIKKLKSEAPLTVLGFGLMVSIAMMIPGANLFVPPAAVAGGCALWLFLQGRKLEKNVSSRKMII